jgi:hypothetical protein
MAVNDIEYFRLCAIKAAVGLELKGMRKRGRSAYSLAKELYNLQGGRQKVHNLLSAMVREEISKREPGNGSK